MTNIRSTYHFSYSPDSMFAFSNGSERRLNRSGARSGDERLLPHAQALVLLLEEDDLPLVVAQAGEIAVVGPVEELAPLVVAAGEQVVLIVAVEMDLEGLAGGVVALRAVSR